MGSIDKASVKLRGKNWVKLKGEARVKLRGKVWVEQIGKAKL